MPQGDIPWRSLIRKGTIDPPEKKLRATSRGVIDAKGTPPFLACPLKSSIRHEPLAICTLENGHSWPPTVVIAQKKFMLVATNYFSKWVEAEAYVSIKDKEVSKFVLKNIVFQFGIS
ncbi:hypothetical protein CK203_114581 [Vitis vinifera]|uniref:Integrase catalytic domain-containing protein n=1 Tax=Vitis vinifera TaxID=29760 RepID=A0A438CDH1_VITVI|nr:hypothetical protein CK203_114581 [Vitis vinifera]